LDKEQIKNLDFDYDGALMFKNKNFNRKSTPFSPQSKVIDLDDSLKKKKNRLVR